VYVITGLTAGIAAFITSAYYGSASSGDAQGYELYVIASAVVGKGVAGVEFAPDGSSTGGTITLRDGARVVRITIDWLTGRVRIVHEA
jgi:ribose transport system permease protein